MLDSYKRQVDYLRLSVTPACPMRCVYCRPAAMKLSHAQALLTPGEIQSLVHCLVEEHGLRKLRLTGGEPTTRPDLLEIVRRVTSIKNLDEVVLTTNGLTMPRQASELAEAGLRRVNISLDSIDPTRFTRITGIAGLPQVLTGIDAAVAAGLGPVKLNCVVIRGQNDGELPNLLLFAAARELEIRFIELMPMGPLSSCWSQRHVPGSEMKSRMRSVVSHWEPLGESRAPARRQLAHLRDGRTARVGFIAAMSEQFCDRCNRIRLASDGTLYPCLMDRPSGNLLHALRPRLDVVELSRILNEGLRDKSAIHPAQGHAVMVQIGG